MHGVSISSRDEEDAQSLKEKQARAAKFQKYRTLCQVAIQSRREHHHDPNAFGLTTKLLSVNPDFYSLWNFRREMILATFPNNKVEGEREVELAKSTIASELKLTRDALEKNPKSYSSWWHRRWVVDTFISKSTDEDTLVDIATELKLCTKFLTLDERNFHCWGYRNHICKLLNKDLLSELDFTQELIERNFSNYSAWNHRTLVLEKLNFDVPSLGSSQLEVVNSELELVHNAIFTEPADQSAWMYMRWLVAAVVGEGSEPSSQPPGNGSLKPNRMQIAGLTQEERVKILLLEVEQIDELLEMEPHSKWAMLTIVQLLKHLKRFNVSSAEDDARIVTLCGMLADCDPVHQNYYTHLRDQRSKT